MNKNLIESDNSALITPDFIGTDEEKINVLQYWSELIGLLRSIKSSVPSHENKIAIISQLKKELELIELEYTNATSQPVGNPDGSIDMKQVTDSEKEDVVVNIDDENQKGKPQNPNYPAPSPLSPHRPLTTEDLKKLAGIR